MTDTDRLLTIQRAYLASYELHHQGTSFYWTSAFDQARRPIIGTRATDIRTAANLAAEVLGKPLRFE